MLDECLLVNNIYVRLLGRENYDGRDGNALAQLAERHEEVLELLVSLQGEWDRVNPMGLAV